MRNGKVRQQAGFVAWDVEGMDDELLSQKMEEGVRAVNSGGR